MMTKQIGFLVAADKATWKPYIDAFTGALATPKVSINYQVAGGNSDNYLPRAQALVNLGVNVIFTSGTGPALACIQANADAVAAGKQPVSVVFAAAGDPVKSGLVQSLNSPGGNLTGGSNQAITLVFKRMEVMCAEFGADSVVGVLGNDMVVADEIQLAMQAATYYFNNPPVQEIVNAAGDFPTAIHNFRNQGVNAVFVCSDPVTHGNADSLDPAHTGMKTMNAFREYVDLHNGTLSYGPSLQQMFADAAGLVDQILAGADPANLPVLMPSKIEQAP
jgi:putative tryptophan/tyrosine transport system substrate-binding protein